MRRISVDLDDEDAEWLEAKIDDTKPTLDDVAQGLLAEFAKGEQQAFGVRVCECDKLERLASAENSSVVFDPSVNEYHLVTVTPNGRTVHYFRYCLSCGGTITGSTRAQLFADVAIAEVCRLSDLCAEVRTFKDAIDRFGQPDFDKSDGLIHGHKTAEGAKVLTPHRVIRYERLSENATVEFTQKLGDLVAVSFTGKYIGPIAG